jgi:uncharacterized membrane protein YcaP (DUF421 family)
MIRALFDQDYVRDLPVVAIYTFVVYVSLIAAFKLLGRRTLGQLTVVDLVIIIIMGSAVETAMVHGNLSLPAGVVSASTLLATNRLIAHLATKNEWFHKLISPSPVLVVADGKLISEHLMRNGLTPEDIFEAIRERGFGSIAEVKFAVMEEDGEINAVPMSAPVVSTANPIRDRSGVSRADSA